jgi:GxxExxY protein
MEDRHALICGCFTQIYTVWKKETPMVYSVNRVELNRITRKIIGCAYAVGRVLKFGYLEKVYENALANEISDEGLKVQQQIAIEVKYKNKVVGTFVTDLMVEEKVLVELKTAKAIDAAHVAQCLNYLTSTGMKICLLINFGEDGVEIKRLVKDF